MSLGFTPPPVTTDLQYWAQNIVAYLRRTASRLQFQSANASAAEDGVLLWDAAGGYPVVSKSNVWRQIVLADGTAVFNQDVDITAAVINTAYKIAFDVVSVDAITLTGSPATEITFQEGGLYLVSFTAQITSTTASTVELRFWPRLNGTNVAGSTIVASLHSNGSTTVVSRSAIFDLNANDVLNVMWATDHLSGYLEAHAATAYAPASPSVTLSITRIKA